LVEIMNNLVRESDLMARIGGEEFVAEISSGHY
jgi:GGDEF domain-containing protein